METKFNKHYNVEGPFKFLELQQAIIDKFGNIQFSKFEYDGKTVYTCGTDFEWETNNITCEDFKYTSTQDALIGLFLDNINNNQSKLIKDEYYSINVILENIIKEVYKG